MKVAAQYTLSEKLNALVLVVNSLGSVEYVGPAVKRLLGYEPARLLGEGWWELTRHSPEQHFIDRAYIVRLLNSSEEFIPRSFERPLKTAGGRIKWIMWSVEVNEDRTLTGVGLDITFHKELQQQLLDKNKELARKNQEVLESIRYAKRIQDAVIQDPLALQHYFSDAFILFRPRDVVSGDFYWYHKKEKKIFAAAVDCTGHGVPGAIMSVIAGRIIRDIIVKQDLDDPAEILYAIDRELQVVLSREDGSNTAADGMDIALLAYNPSAGVLEFAGAFRSLLLMQDGAINEYRGSRYPIGAYEGEKKFENARINVKAGDRAYLFSDGYTDQFGGPEIGKGGKKLNHRRFLELLSGSAEMEMEEQRSFLDYALNNWKQDLPQTDDILVMGIKF